MSNGVRSCPLCGDSGFVKVATRCNPEGEWEARMKCEECGIELIKSGETEDAAITELLKAWNTRAEREVGISKFQKLTGTNYEVAKRTLSALNQVGLKVVE